MQCRSQGSILGMVASRWPMGEAQRCRRSGPGVLAWDWDWDGRRRAWQRGACAVGREVGRGLAGSSAVGHASLAMQVGAAAHAGDRVNSLVHSVHSIQFLCPSAWAWLRGKGSGSGRRSCCCCCRCCRLGEWSRRVARWVNASAAYLGVPPRLPPTSQRLINRPRERWLLPARPGTHESGP